MFGFWDRLFDFWTSGLSDFLTFGTVRLFDFPTFDFVTFYCLTLVPFDFSTFGFVDFGTLGL